MKIYGLCVFVLISTLVSAQGKLTGKVTDKETGDASPGANVTLEETSLGSASSLEGTYEIKEIPPGTYTVVSQMIGYSTVKIDSVVIFPDSTTVVDIEMEPVVIEGEEIGVSAERAHIMKDFASSISVRNCILLPAPEAPPVFNTEEYSKIDEDGFLNVLESPLSTFAADVDAASYGNARMLIIQHQLPVPHINPLIEFVPHLFKMCDLDCLFAATCRLRLLVPAQT